MVKSNTSLFSMCFPLRKVRRRKLNQRKNMRSNSSNMSIPQGQHHPSCMWGIFHVLKYHRWNRRFIKKRISSKKQDAGAEESNKNAVDSSKHKKVEAPDSNSKVEGKKKSPGAGCKASVTSRLKALITDKGKGNHQRSSTYPIPSKSDPDNQVEHLPDMEQTHGSRPRANKNKGICNESCAEDQAVSEECASSDENYEYCSPWTCWGKEKVDGNTKTLLESAILSREELDVRKKAVHEYNNDRDGPGHESKYLMDALDIIKMNQGFLLTVLQDPDSPLAHHFHKQLAMDAKMGLSQCESFPSTGSTSRGNQSPDGTWFDGKGKEVDVSSNGEKPGDYESAEDFCRKSMPMIAKDHRGEGIHILNQAQAKLADLSSSPTSSHDLNRSEMARNRFKCLSENLRYVIEERTKERHRIAMDAVLHKIPHQKGFSKDLSPDIVDHVKDPARTRKLLSSRSAREQKTSFNESMDRYAQLYEHSCSKESKEESISKGIRGRRDEPFESRRSRKKSMRRILSSPELYSAAYLREAFPYPPDMSAYVDEHKFLESVALGYISEVDNFESEDNSFQHFSDQLSQVKKPDDEPENLMVITDKISQSEEDSKPETMPITKMEGPSSEEAKDTSAECSKLQDIELSDDLQREAKDILKVAGGGIIELQQLEDLKKDLDAIDKQEFRYVKDVLELAGFSGDEALGAWHAEKQPLDPMMYEEIRGCAICDPNCSTEGEEVGYCNHPLLFALINEVLLDVYERSHSYYPRALSHLCHLRPMPAGRHVLEQVWERISWFLSFKTGYDKPLDYVAGRDLMGDDGWMSLQTEHESLALEVEDLIFTDLLQELSSST